MASPFPGMDPWLEHPSIWPDFHDALAGEIRAALNGTLPEPYYAQLGAREELGIVGVDDKPRTIVPDVSVHRSSDEAAEGGGGIAVATGPRTELTESLQLRNEMNEVNFVEIRDSKSNHEIVTLIEILSPSNKLPGSDRQKYIRKREHVMASKTSLIEIDLLRCGGRDVLGDYVASELRSLDHPPEYVVLVQRAWLRSSKWMDCEIFLAPLTGSLPVLAIPLREGEPESTLDLQYAFHQTYTRGPYQRGAVDYSSNPEPELNPHQRQWAQTLLDARK